MGKTDAAISSAKRMCEAGQDIELLKIFFRRLRSAMRDVGEDDIVAICNALGDPCEKPVGWALKAWGDEHCAESIVVEYEKGSIHASDGGEAAAYRRTKKSFGAIKAIYEGPGLGSETDYICYVMSDDNPIRVKQKTRNELKLATAPDLVNDAVRQTRKDFLSGLKDEDRKTIQRIGLDAIPFWRAAKYGNDGLADRLGRRPNKKREQWRKAGRAVA